MTSSWAHSAGFLTDVTKFTEATAIWQPLWLEGRLAAQVQGTVPSARAKMLFLAAASKLWVFGGKGPYGTSRHPICEAGPASDCV